MIKKTILVFIILFALYSGIVLLNPRMGATQHQWQENVVKGEKYIYNTSDSIHSVILGSSLASRIIMDSLPGFYNLAFAGQGILDGLEILKNSNKYPQHIFIETNSILGEKDKGFISTLFSPLSYYPKKYCPSLRNDKHPLALLFPLVQQMLHKKVDSKEYETKSVSTDPKEQAQAAAMFSKVLQIEIDFYAQQPDSVYLGKQFAQLKDLLDGLKNKDVHIIFFEMPLNPKLVELPMATGIRKWFYDLFPENEYSYIKVPDCSGYVTTDGLHLNEKEAVVYTAYFKEAAKKYLP
jgi:hypothetical protein